MAKDDQKKLPAELLPTLISVSDTGSAVKAARGLGISRTAVNAHLKRVQRLLDDPVVVTSDDDSALTEIGQHLIRIARQRLDEHRRTGSHSTAAEKPIRLGVGSVR